MESSTNSTNTDTYNESNRGYYKSKRKIKVLIIL